MGLRERVFGAIGAFGVAAGGAPAGAEAHNLTGVGEPTTQGAVEHKETAAERSSSLTEWMRESVPVRS